ncbi:transport and Golgi organization protein 2-like [Ctenocephalides felis]|uniref:transport and Golgi organization protein 2-like n=1 Tax=Ctenocephalides felis TaxID=7515 RepID=UPI000E6E44A3|nr:transport and Golgi organization protein 2-like [Ctenocephalides felis]
MQIGREGGTWFAVRANENGLRIGSLLNVTGKTLKPNCPGRGSIVSNYVKSESNTKDYTEDLKSKMHDYNLFNFLTAEITKENCVVQCTNSESKITKEWVADGKQEVIKIGVSNSEVDKPFKKVQSGSETFSKLVESTANKDILVEKLLSMMQCSEKHWPDEVLYERNPTWGEELSSIFIANHERKYGTRTHTIVLLDYDWKLDFIDVSLNSDGQQNFNKWCRKHITRKLKV